MESPAESSDFAEQRSFLLDANEDVHVDTAVALLAECERLYQRGGRLVQVVRRPRRHAQDEPGLLAIASVEPARVRELLASKATWQVRRESGDPRTVHPPKWLVDGAMARREWPVPALDRLAESPVLRPNGTVLQEAGFDRETRTHFQPYRSFPIVPDEPSAQDVAAAVDTLLGVVGDFPFQDDAHRATWLAAVLTPMARPAIRGPVPLFLFDANTPGSGKTLMARAAGIIATGASPCVQRAPMKDEEWQKVITSLLLEGDPVVLFDNVVGRLGCPALDLALTGETYKGRILGRSEMTPALPISATFFATSNNAELGADTSRRTLHVKLRSPLEHPEDRPVSEFRRPDLIEWVQAEQPGLAVAALTLLRHRFTAKGLPELPAWGSFEGFTKTVRQAVVLAGLPDPWRSREALVLGSDLDAQARVALVRGLHELTPSGATAADILRLVETDSGDAGPRQAVRAALEHLTPGTVSTRSVGRALGRLKERNIDGLQLIQKSDRNGATWRVVPVPEAESQS